MPPASVAIICIKWIDVAGEHCYYGAKLAYKDGEGLAYVSRCNIEITILTAFSKCMIICFNACLQGRSGSELSC